MSLCSFQYSIICLYHQFSLDFIIFLFLISPRLALFFYVQISDHPSIHFHSPFTCTDLDSSLPFNFIKLFFAVKCGIWNLPDCFYTLNVLGGRWICQFLFCFLSFGDGRWMSGWWTLKAVFFLFLWRLLRPFILLSGLPLFLYNSHPHPIFRTKKNRSWRMGKYAKKGGHELVWYIPAWMVGIWGRFVGTGGWTHRLRWAARANLLFLAAQPTSHTSPHIGQAALIPVHFLFHPILCM